MGVSLPIPIFDRNQGRVEEMQALIAASEAEARLTRNELERNLRQAHERLRYALSASRVLKEEVLPRAEEVLRVAEVRYAGGDSSLTDILPVRRDYIGVRLSYLESLREVMQAWANLSPYLKEGGSHEDS